MGISVSVVTATDDEIRAFPGADGELEAALSRRIAHGEDVCYLADYWDGLHYLLTGEAQGGEAPLSVLKWGDVRYSGLDDPVHALFSNTVRALAGAVLALPETVLRERFDPPTMMTVGEGGRPLYPGRYWLSSTPGDGVFRALMSHLGKLRDYVSAAAAADEGLLVCRYEDW